MHSSIIRTYEDVTWHGISGDRWERKYRTCYSYCQWTFSDSCSVCAYRQQSYLLAYVYFRLRIFLSCLRGRGLRASWKESVKSRGADEDDDDDDESRSDAGCSNAEFNRVDWFHGKNSAPICTRISPCPGRRSSPFAQRREISPIHSCNCAKSNCTEADRVVLD